MRPASPAGRPEKRLNHEGTKVSGAILWFTGLSGSGKSTLAQAVAERTRGFRPIKILDGDEIRGELSKDLGFSKEDRDTSVRRVGALARTLAGQGLFVIVATISPYADARAEVRRLADADGTPFVLAFLDASMPVLIARDSKGLYRRALAGELLHFTGVSDPYERPLDPDLVVNTDSESVDASTTRILAALVARGLIAKTPDR
jgi:adenylylsulfate kinase